MRYEPAGMTSAGIVKPDQYREKEVRSTMWGKVIKVPEREPCPDEAFVNDLVPVFRDAIDVGMWVEFLPQNTINGGLPNEPLIQMTAYTDVKLVLTDEAFNRLVRDKE